MNSARITATTYLDRMSHICFRRVDCTMYTCTALSTQPGLLESQFSSTRSQATFLTTPVLYKPAAERIPKCTSCKPHACNVLTPVMASVAIMPTKPSIASLQRARAGEQRVSTAVAVVHCWNPHWDSGTYIMLICKKLSKKSHGMHEHNCHTPILSVLPANICSKCGVGRHTSSLSTA